ncbi:MAG: PaaI family thioesterase [Proteobacteria bacterium]|nr:PaaI family thioesterase [Pseudomonadota bacterium]
MENTSTNYIEHQKSHCNCIVCGSDNPISLGLKFNVEPDGSVRTQFRGSSLFQGYKGILHGGIIAALLDATMTHCLFHQGVEAVTGDLQIRFLESVPCGSQLDLHGRLVSKFSPLYKLESELICDKRLMARAKANFMKPLK